jgi:four helix bundle protein
MKDFGPTQDLAQRTKLFALDIIRLSTQLPKTPETRVLVQQIVKSGTSVAANYRAVCRARSRAEFIAKLGTVVEEADENMFWLELLIESGIAQENRTKVLLQEAKELLGIFSAFSRLRKNLIHASDMAGMFREVPTPGMTSGCSKRLSSKAATSEGARRTLRYVEPMSDVRTPLADFFSILLGERQSRGDIQ